MKKDKKLYNMIFPPYIEFLFTPLVFIPIIGNFIIDGLLVLVITFSFCLSVFIKIFTSEPYLLLMG